MTDREYEEKVAQIRDDYGVGLGEVKDPDVVKVVRCKDCKYYAQTEELGGYCKCHSGELPFDWYSCGPDDFCSYGERKDEREENESR